MVALAADNTIIESSEELGECLELQHPSIAMMAIMYLRAAPTVAIHWLALFNMAWTGVHIVQLLSQSYNSTDAQASD